MLFQRRRCQIFTQKCGKREALYNVKKVFSFCFILKSLTDYAIPPLVKKLNYNLKKKVERDKLYA